jgi:DnaK suppressor protein
MNTLAERATQERERLEAERERALAELQRIREWLRTEVDVDLEEGDPDLFEREKNLALVTTLQRKVESIDAALRAIERGTYGICERCGQEIDPARLEVRPDATLCVRCQAEVERIARRSAQIEEEPPLPPRF